MDIREWQTRLIEKEQQIQIDQQKIKDEISGGGGKHFIKLTKYYLKSKGNRRMEYKKC